MWRGGGVDLRRQTSTFYLQVLSSTAKKAAVAVAAATAAAIAKALEGQWTLGHFGFYIKLVLIATRL